MKFNLLDNLIIVTIESRNYLVDKGSNLSFSLNDNNLDLVINDNNYSLKPNLASAIVKDALNHLIPRVVVDGVTGTDIICETSLTIDYLNQEIYFDVVECSYDIEKFYIPFETKMGYIFVKMYLYSNNLSMLVDSGAKIGYVKTKYLDLNKPVGEFDDYSPEIGEIKGNTYSFYDSYHQENVLVGKLPKQYEFICDGIVPLYEFVRPGYCVFDFKNNLFGFTRRFL